MCVCLCGRGNEDKEIQALRVCGSACVAVGGVVFSTKSEANCRRGMPNSCCPRLRARLVFSTTTLAALMCAVSLIELLAEGMTLAEKNGIPRCGAVRAHHQ